MNKKIKFIGCVIAAIIVIGGVVGFMVYNKINHSVSDYIVESDYSIKEEDFESELNNLNMMENTWQTAVPQTEVYNIIKKHFNSPLPEGKTVKKAIVIGYDGCRVDNFRLIESSKRSAIKHILDNKGHAIFSYAGGANYPEKNIQDTSTAPGWCSMLTGKLSDEHHITENGIPKDIEPKTLLLSLVENKTIRSSAFYVSWNGHFVKKNSTYINEKKYIEENGIDATFSDAKNDNGTKENIINDLQQKECSDFIFSTLEYTDHSGHATGFTLDNIKYKSAFRDADAAGMDIIDTIENRDSYKKEDWLILITTDHGGIKRDHGGASFEERMTFIVANKKII